MTGPLSNQPHRGCDRLFIFSVGVRNQISRKVEDESRVEGRKEGTEKGRKEGKKEGLIFGYICLEERVNREEEVAAKGRC